ncbi:MAG: TonB-dependent receptor [Chitinophagaceae bacterium]|nr:TonB-dependent receptor [Chitinophagaceae bacterium]
MNRPKGLVKKALLVMKLTTIFLLTTFMQVYADGFSQQRVSLSLESAELKTVLNQIEKKTNYRFLYNQSILNKSGKYTVKATNEFVPTLLDKIFQGSAISYKIVNQTLVVLAEGASDVPMPQEVKGKVTDAEGKPIPGASITVKGTKTGTAADAEGNFSLTVPDNAVLVISAVGYASQEIPVAGLTSFDVQMVSSSGSGLNEVVVIGYGTASRRDLTGSIAKISGDEVSKRPNPNPVASLQGLVAGVSVVNSGVPGQEPDIRIRGTNSINGAKPLYVVDGILNDNIDFLNPNDIESMEILKDPSSLAIFGVRGANGVIAITTKRGRTGKLSINFNTNTGFKKLVDRIDYVNAAEFKELYQEQEANDNIDPSLRFNFSPWTGDTDWIEEMTRTAFFSNTNLSVQQGGEKNKFYAGIGYTLDQGVIKNQELQRFYINISDEVKLHKNIKLGMNLNFMRQQLPFSQANGLLFDARRVLPITPTMDPTGTYFTELAIQSAQIGNPLMNLENKWDKELIYENRYLGNIYLDFNFLKKFNFRTTFYADQSVQDTRRYNPIIYVFNPSVGPAGSVYVDRNNRLTSVDQSQQRWNKYQQDYILTYKNNWGDHSFTGTAGFTTVYNNFSGIYGSVSQRSDGDSIGDDPRFWYLNTLLGDPTTRRANSSQWENSVAGLLFRGLYNYQNKYYLNASFRRDGSSQISPDERWQNYYSVGAAWEVTREAFFQNQKIFDFLKIKGSYGVLGSQNVPGGNPYPFYPGLIQGNTAVFGTTLAPAYSQSYIPDRNLRWESIEGWEAGFEANMMRNRLHVEAVYYYKKTRDILAFQRVTGSPQPTLTNVGEMQNQGWELSASWTQQFNRDFKLVFSGNFTTYNNKVLQVDEIPPSEERPNRTISGQPIGYFYGYVVEGIYQSYADKLKSPPVTGYDYGPGDLKYKDVNGDGVINTDDRTFIGNPTPDFAYGFSVNGNYKRLDFGIDFQGVYGNEIYRYWGSSELPFTQFNYAQFRMNRWTGPGTSNWEPAMTERKPINRLPSTYGIEDGSYFRIRNVNLGYTFKMSPDPGAVVKGVRVFANVQNLKTWKANSGYTPEFGGSTTAFGIDDGNGPMPMVVTGGVNVTF